MLWFITAITLLAQRYKYITIATRKCRESATSARRTIAGPDQCVRPPARYATALDLPAHSPVQLVLTMLTNEPTNQHHRPQNLLTEVTKFCTVPPTIMDGSAEHEKARPINIKRERNKEKNTAVWARRSQRRKSSQDDKPLSPIIIETFDVKFLFFAYHVRSYASL